MKNKRFLLLPIIALSMATFVSCGNKNKSSSQSDNPVESFEQKHSLGLPAFFDESDGYQNEDPCIIQNNENEVFVYYTRNLTKNTSEDECICVKHGILKDNKWSFDETKIVLKTSDDEWDSSHIFAPSVIKGDFVFDGNMYRYLLAYGGTNQDDRASSQIGLAVSNFPDREFIRISEKPIVSYEPDDWGVGLSTAKGVSDPSLVSKNQSNQVWLFYSFYSPTVSASERMVELDISKDIKNLISYDALEGSVIANKGIVDYSTVPTLLAGDFAYDEFSNSLYVVNDFYPAATSSKPYAPQQVALYRANINDVLYTIPSPEVEIEGWTPLGRINKDSTIADGKTGYSRIYSASLFKNAYGHVEIEDQIDALITVSETTQENPQYKRGTQILNVSIKLGD